MKEINNLITNEIFINENFFTSIIGLSPSKGARSPLLWNAAFKAFDFPAKMYPLDVEKENVENLIQLLQETENYKGGAVAAPYKIIIADILKNNLTPEARAIGAINCIFRDKNGFLKGTNTDGEAALKCILKNTNDLKNNNVLVLGFGGVSKAVCAYVSKYLAKGSKLIVSCRQDNIPQKEMKNLGISKIINIQNTKYYLEGIKVLINCTSIGWNEQSGSSPILKDELTFLAKDAFIFDVIYQPLETKFLSFANSLGIKNSNGLEMNLEQALLAFKYAFPKLIINDEDDIRLLNAMKNA